MAANIKAQVTTFVEDAKKLTETLPDQLKSGKIELNELLLLNALYLGFFGLITYILPSLGTMVYGGDDEFFYSNDWVKCLAASNIVLAFISTQMKTWEEEPRTTVLKAFFALYVLNALSNLYILLYGSLSVIVFLNAILDGGLAFFHAQHAGIFKKKQ